MILAAESAAEGDSFFYCGFETRDGRVIVCHDEDVAALMPSFMFVTNDANRASVWMQETTSLESLRVYMGELEKAEAKEDLSGVLRAMDRIVPHIKALVEDCDVQLVENKGDEDDA